MFEKEGIKYAIEETVGTECLSMPIEDFNFIDLSEPQQEKAQCFKDGAEFGYNKAKLEVEESYRESLCNSELNLASVTEQLEELEKANEWHYVKDRDLPKEDLRPRTLGYYLTVSKHKSYKGFVFEVAYFTGVIFTKGGDILDNVIAWKELVLPKE